MIQLDNTIKGKEMELSPEQVALNERVVALPVIKELQDTDRELIQGQEAIQEHLEEVDNRLQDGKEVMDAMKLNIDSLFKMFTDHIRTTHDNHKEAMGAISNLNTEVKDNKIKDVVQESRQQKEEFNAYKEKVWSVVKIFLTGTVSLVVGGLAVYFFGK